MPLWTWRKHLTECTDSDSSVPKDERVPEQIVKLVEEMHSGTTTRVRTECGVPPAEFPDTMG